MDTGFSINYDNTDEKLLLPVGEYEVIIKDAEERCSKGGTGYIGIPLAVRNDINQKYKNAVIWHKIFMKKEPNEEDKKCELYNAKQINSISKAAGLPRDKRYANLREWFKDLKHRVLRVSVKHEEYNNIVDVKVENMYTSNFPVCNHVFKENKTTTGINIINDDMPPLPTDDDLPF